MSMNSTVTTSMHVAAAMIITSLSILADVHMIIMPMRMHAAADTITANMPGERC